jgi:hypothetical protein
VLYQGPGGEEILHVEGSVDPLRDIDIINTELMLADLETVDGAIGKAERAAKSGRQGIGGAVRGAQGSCQAGAGCGQAGAVDDRSMITSRQGAQGPG